MFFTGQGVWPVVVVSVQGPGGDCAEEPVFRCEPVTQATETFLVCPARTRWSSIGDASGVGGEVTKDDVAEPALEGTDRFARGVSFGELAVVVVAAGAVAVTDLGDRRAVQGVVQAAVAAS